MDELSVQDARTIYRRVVWCSCTRTPCTTVEAVEVELIITPLSEGLLTRISNKLQSH